MSAQPPSGPNPLDELKTGVQESPPLDELKAGLSDKQPLVQNAQPRYSFGWFDKWLLAIPIAIGLIICFLLWSYISGTPAPTTATLHTPAPDATLQANVPLTITGTAPPNSTVQIYNHGQLVAETTADENGNFMVRFGPVQPGSYELTAVATVNGEQLESPPVQFVIAEESGQTALEPTSASNQTAIATAGTTTATGTEGGTPGATTPGAEGGAQGATTPGTEDGTSAPTTVTLQPPAPDATLQAGESLTITGTAPPNSTVQIYNNGQLVGETTADANGNFVVSVAPGQAGAYELTAVATTPDGTTLESPPIQFVIAEAAGPTTPGAAGGTSAPTTASLQPPAPDATLEAGESLTLTGTAPPNSTVQIYHDGQVVAETTADANGNFVVSVVPAQAGAYELTAVATAPDGTTLESPPLEFVIAEGAAPTTPSALGGTPAPANQTTIASAGGAATSVAAAANGTTTPGTEGGASAPTTVALQPAAPDATLQAGESLTITGTAPPNSTVQIYNNGQLVAEATADANGNFVVSVVPGQAGAYELTATATTPDGTTLESPPMQFVIAEGTGQTTPTAAGGTSAPTTVTLQPASPDATLQAGESLTITGTAPPNSTVQIYNDGQLVAQTTADANGNFVVSVAPGQAGAHELTAVATTPDGTTLESPPTQFVIADESGGTPAPGQTAPANQTTIASAGEAATSVAAAANGTPVPGAEGGAQGATTPGAEGGAQAATTPGTEGGAQGATTPGTEGGTSAPTTVTLQSPAPDATLQAGESLTITGSAPPNSTVQIYNNGQLVAEATADENGNFVLSFTPLQPGAYELTAVATTPDGTTLESPPMQFVIADESGGTPVAGTENGASVPTTTTLQTIAGDTTPQAGEPLTITGTAPPNSTVQLYNNGQLVAEVTADENGNFAVSFTPLQPGTYELTAIATSPDGTQLESPPIEFVINDESGGTPVAGAQGGASAPTTTTLQTIAGDTTPQAGETLTITGTAPPNSKVQIYNNGQLVAETTADENGNFVVSVVPGQAGAHELTAVATTTDGTKIESPPIQFVIADESGGTPVAGTEGGAQGGAQAATTPGAANAQGNTPAAPPTVNVLGGQNLAPGATLSGTGVPGSVVTIYLNDTEIGTVTVGADGTWQFTLPMDLAPGSYTLHVVSKSPDASASGSKGGTATVTESEDVKVTVSPMLLPVTGGKPRICWPW